jgi:hypothetical protein
MEAIYLETPSEHIAYIKLIFESYEEVGIIRTADRKRAVIVLLVVEDFIAVARDILESLKQEVPLAEIPPPANMSDDWLMAELAKE